jgi:hypothetical protein
LFINTLDTQQPPQNWRVEWPWDGAFLAGVWRRGAARWGSRAVKDEALGVAAFAFAFFGGALLVFQDFGRGMVRCVLNARHYLIDPGATLCCSRRWV